uniref:cell envelope biogenesis protein TolA n=1 Tax=Xinfangfangia pollutisoli TaxID=2865960 RepID=UPI001CD7E784
PQPEAQPAPEPQPAPQPEPEPEPLPVSPEPQPEDVAVAPVDQPLPSMSSSTRPKPKPADVVSPVVETPPEEAVTAESPTPAVSETPVETPVEPPKEATQEVVPEDTGDVLRTEATEDQTEALGMTASVRPKSKPARPKPTETPAKPAASESPSSAATAEDSSDSDADAIAAAVAAAAAEEEPAASSGAQGGGRSGPPLTAGEIGDISSVIGKKWNVGSLSTDALSSVVVLRVEFSPDGRPGNITLIESSGPSQAGIQVAFDAARRAIQIAYRDGGIPLPADKYDTWKVLEFSFDGNGMRLR